MDNEQKFILALLGNILSFLVVIAFLTLFGLCFKIDVPFYEVRLGKCEVSK